MTKLEVSAPEASNFRPLVVEKLGLQSLLASLTVL